MWYYVTARDEGQHRTIPNVFPNLNAGDPAKFLYAPDRTREVRGAESWRLYSGRATVQATSRDKINFHWDEQHACNGATFTSTGDGCRQQPESEAAIGPLGLGGLTSTTSPEIGGYLDTHPRVRLLTWQSTATNRMLFDAGFGAYQSPFGPRESPGNTTRPLARVTEQCAAGCTANGGIPNLTYRSANWGHSWDAQYTWRASVSYVTGAHNLKVGYGGVALVSDLENHTNDLNLALHRQQRRADLAHAEPAAVHDQLSDAQRVVLRAGPVDARTHDAPGRAALRSQLELLTRADDSGVGLPRLAAGLPGNPRRDRLQRPLPARRRGLRPLRQREDGREGELRQVPRADEQQQQLHPVEPDHPHRDDGAARLDRLQRQLRMPDCDLRNQAAQNLTATGGDICAASNAQTFGTTAQTTANIDPKILSGWGVRSNDWQIGASVQQQVLPRVSVEFGYFRRWLNNFTITDNLVDHRGRLHAVQHHRAVGSAAAGWRRLRGQRSQQRGARASSARPATTSRSPTTSAISIRRYNGVLFNVSARLGAGVQFQGGINSGKTVQDNCAVRAAGAGVDDRAPA